MRTASLSSNRIFLIGKDNSTDQSNYIANQLQYYCFVNMNFYCENVLQRRLSVMGLKSPNLLHHSGLDIDHGPLITVNFSPLCAWFPPCYYEKCTPRGEGGGRVIFQWFPSNFSRQSGVQAKTAMASSMYLKSVFFKSAFFQMHV